ncbi:hypothetical protein ACFHWD_03650 [Clostridium sp. MT-14]|uniref:hypothetical protein n=1 Tax=Clostridium sp. MT-14 TaxID=3348360 RepID=UPI0035F418F6
MNRLKQKIIMDSRLKKNIESLYKYENECCSVKFKDIDDVFWFNNITGIQEFLNNQAVERYYDKSLRKGYFDYINDHGEKFRYLINKVFRGRLEVKEEKINA